MRPDNPLQVFSFASDLGWIAILGSNSVLKQLVFGYPSRSTAVGALDRTLVGQAKSGDWFPALVEQLQEYAAGLPNDFTNVQVDLGHLTPFQHRVVKHCRAIGYGRTQSYGDLAKASGSAGAARAVGHTMATNRVSLIVPCHRVINSNGSAGNFGAPDGARMKLRLLEMERLGSGDLPKRFRPRRVAVR